LKKPALFTPNLPTAKDMEKESFLKSKIYTIDEN